MLWDEPPPQQIGLGPGGLLRYTHSQCELPPASCSNGKAMPTENTSTAWVHERLDALDRVLLGLLPRHERLEIVAQVEKRIGEQATVESPVDTDRCLPLDTSSRGTVDASVASRRSRGKLSRVALTAGILGIVAAVFLFASPIVYLLAGIVGEAFDEMGVFVLLGSHVAVLSICGTAAVVTGIIALIKLGRNQQLRGYGWAITGLCAGPLPMLLGVLPILLMLVSASAVVTTNSAPVAAAGQVAPVTLQGSDESIPYQVPQYYPSQGPVVLLQPLPPALPASATAPVDMAPSTATSSPETPAIVPPAVASPSNVSDATVARSPEASDVLPSPAIPSQEPPAIR
jgi:uncharacterized membrane protein HdeD (DUF308 family)